MSKDKHIPLLAIKKPLLFAAPPVKTYSCHLFHNQPIQIVQF